MNDQPINKTRIALFGASTAGQRALDKWPDSFPSIQCILDNDASKWGQVMHGIPVSDPSLFINSADESCFIVIASSYVGAITSQLKNTGMVEWLDFATLTDALDYQLLTPPPVIHAQDARKPPRALIMPITWFGLDHINVQQQCASAGIECLLAMPLKARPAVPWKTTPDTFITDRHKGVPIYKACEYELCVRLRTERDRIDPANPVHWQAIRDIMGECVELIDRCVSVLDRLRPDIAVYPQGHHMASAVLRYLCILRDIRILALENSMSNTRMVWDTLCGVAVNKIAARNAFWKWDDLINTDDAIRHRDRYLGAIKSLKSDQHASPTDAGQPICTSGKPIVLYVANVLTDASVMFNSRVGSQVEAIRMTAQWAISNGYAFVLKLHPRERPGHNVNYENLTWNALMAQPDFRTLANSPDCVIDQDNRFDTYGLIKACTVCVTVCSQTGLEALLLNRQTVLLGDAYYGGLGFTHEVHQACQFGWVMQQAINSADCMDNVIQATRFFYVFDTRFCEDKTETGLARLINRSI